MTFSHASSPTNVSRFSFPSCIGSFRCRCTSEIYIVQELRFKADRENAGGSLILLQRALVPLFPPSPSLSSLKGKDEGEGHWRLKLTRFWGKFLRIQNSSTEEG